MSGLFSLKDARISYGKTEIVHGVDIDIAPGEFCALLGLNGYCTAAAAFCRWRAVLL